MAHTDEHRVVRFDADSHELLSVELAHVLHLPALPMHTGETVRNDSASIQHTVIRGTGSLTLVQRTAPNDEQLTRFVHCSNDIVSDNEALASCMLINTVTNKRGATIVKRAIHEPLRVTEQPTQLHQQRRRQPMSTPANATNPAYIANPRSITTCANVATCPDLAFSVQAPREPKHRFERGIGDVNAFTTLRAVSDVKLPNASTGGDIVVFAGATVQVTNPLQKKQ
jgi:hypothetical protein